MENFITKLNTLNIDNESNLFYKNKETKIMKKKKIIKSINYLIKWLNKNIDNEDSINMLYYIIYVHRYIIYSFGNNIDIIKRLKNYENILHSFLDSKDFMFDKYIKIKPWINHNIYKYDKNINYKLKIQEIIDHYIKTIDLEINFLPDFIEYNNCQQVILWITFCKALNKKHKNPKPNYFLYDIYLFQNENNNLIKINILIQILRNLNNYIQYFDYEKK